MITLKYNGKIIAFFKDMELAQQIVRDWADTRSLEDAELFLEGYLKEKWKFNYPGSYWIPWN